MDYIIILAGEGRDYVWGLISPSSSCPLGAARADAHREAGFP